jgi:hypothetical protein
MTSKKRVKKKQQADRYLSLPKRFILNTMKSKDLCYGSNEALSFSYLPKSPGYPPSQITT